MICYVISAIMISDECRSIDRLYMWALRFSYAVYVIRVTLECCLQLEILKLEDAP